MPVLEPWQLPLLAAALLACLFTATWWVQLHTENAGIVDTVWSYSLGFLGVLYAALGHGNVVARTTLAVFSLLWGVRLGTHLWVRNHGKPEDGRYRRFREQWQDKAPRNMFWFFQLQVFFAIWLSAGFLVVAYAKDEPNALALGAAVLVWLVSMGGEALSDWQLWRFKADGANRGKVCQVGLWRYSRHPNYFFECLHWLCYPLLALSSPWLLVALMPPFVMAWLLLKVSGVPLTEAQTAKSRPDYASYMRTTSMLIPWPPKPID
jgi:steroid 5-alpha reductase family enzyme